MLRCSVFFIFILFSETDCKYHMNFSKILNDHTFLNLFGITISQCEHECSIRPACKSINYCTHLKECQLNSEDEQNGNLTDRHGFIYAEKQMLPDLSDQNNSSSGQVCENNSTCAVMECSASLNIPGVWGNMVSIGSKRLLTCPDDVNKTKLTTICDTNGLWNLELEEAFNCLNICTIDYLVSGERPISNSSISAPTSFKEVSGEYLHPFLARLSKNGSSNTTFVWAPQDPLDPGYIQATFPTLKLIKSVTTMGRSTPEQWVKKYTVLYSQNCIHFHYVTKANETVVFDGEWNLRTNPLPVPVLALCVRIYPKDSFTYPSLKFDFTGCHLLQETV